MRDETFGPVLPIMRVRDEEAVRLANDSRYGLNSSVWSADDERAEQIARAIEAGNVCINDCMVSYAVAGLLFGGVKESGIGRIHGVEGLRAFCKQQVGAGQPVRPPGRAPVVPAGGLGHGVAASDRAPALLPGAARQAEAVAQTGSGADLGQDRLGLVDDLGTRSPAGTSASIDPTPWPAGRTPGRGRRRPWPRRRRGWRRPASTAAPGPGTAGSPAPSSYSCV